MVHDETICGGKQSQFFVHEHVFQSRSRHFERIASVVSQDECVRFREFVDQTP
jgi:hypothetical protein